MSALAVNVGYTVWLYVWVMLNYILPFIVLISPSEITAYSGGSATYFCITSGSINTETVRGVQWFIDGVQRNDLQHGTEEVFVPDNENSGQLHFTGPTLDLDMSVISCAAVFESGSTESSSTQSLLRVQGNYIINYSIPAMRCVAMTPWVTPHFN